MDNNQHIISPMQFYDSIEDEETKLSWRLMRRLNLNHIYQIFSPTTSEKDKNLAFRDLFKELTKQLAELREPSVYNIDNEEETVKEEDIEMEMMEPDLDNLQWVSMTFGFNPLSVFPTHLLEMANKIKNNCSEYENTRIQDETNLPTTICLSLINGFSELNLSDEQWRYYVLFGLNFIDRILFKNNEKITTRKEAMFALSLQFSLPIAKIFCKTANFILNELRPGKLISKTMFPFNPYDILNQYNAQENYPLSSNRYLFKKISLIEVLDDRTIGVHDYDS